VPGFGGAAGGESYVVGAGDALRLGCRPSEVCLPTKSFGLPWKTSEGKYLCCSSQSGHVTMRE
jgi:hypothetical protein